MTALEAALRRIATKDRFESEVRSDLLGRGFDPADVESAVARLREQGVLNDLRTLDGVVLGRTGKRSVGPERLREELAARGAPSELVEEALAEIDPVEGAVQALAAKFGPDADRAKAGRFLCSRGFDDDSVESALDRFFAAND